MQATRAFRRSQGLPQRILRPWSPDDHGAHLRAQRPQGQTPQVQKQLLHSGINGDRRRSTWQSSGASCPGPPRGISASSPARSPAPGSLLAR